MVEKINSNNETIKNQKEILGKAEKLSNDLLTKALLYSIENVKNEKDNKVNK